MVKQDKFEEIMELNPLYKSFFAKSFKDLGLNGNSFELMESSKGCSDKSLWFTEKELKRLFGMKIIEGMDKHIRTIHSSKLLAVLFFKWMGVKYPLSIDNITYTNVHFEVKNKCAGDHCTSCIDVMLVSEDEKTLLFLDSMFMDYLHVGNSKGISEKYRMFYDSLDLFDESNLLQMTPVYKDRNGKDVFDLISRNGIAIHHCEGIKHLISSYIGLLCEPADSETDDYKRIFDNANNIILGAILYKFDDPRFDDYCDLYIRLAESLNKLDIPFKRKVNVRETILTYQDLKKANTEFQLDDNIKRLYQL